MDGSRRMGEVDGAGRSAAWASSNAGTAVAGGWQQREEDENAATVTTQRGKRDGGNARWMARRGWRRGRAATRVPGEDGGVG